MQQRFPTCSALCPCNHHPGPPPPAPAPPPQEELLAGDLASALAQMHAAGRYGRLLLLADTCQASTLYDRVTAPHVLGVASSKLGEAPRRAGGGAQGQPHQTACCPAAGAGS